MGKKKRRRHKKKIVVTSWFGFFVLLLGAAAITTYYFLSRNNNITKNENQNETLNGDDIGFEYVRPPIGAKFSFDSDNTKNFILSASHFDSPGTSNTEKPSDVSGQGQQEVGEAYNIDKVLDFFKKYFNTNNIIFSADTNIKQGNQNKSFNTEMLDKKGYSFLFLDDKNHASSLSNGLNKFANPYDKTIYSFDSFVVDNSYSDIEGVLKKNINNGFVVDTFKTISSTNNPGNVGWIEDESHLWAKPNNPQTEDEKLYNYAKYGISDHVPIGMNIKTIDTNESIRVGFWNVLNFSFTKKPISSSATKPSDNLSDTMISEAKKQSHARNIAKIVNNCNFDLISFVEINNNTSGENFNYFIKYLNSLDSTNNYSGFLSKPTSSTVASSGQIEQVAYIYNEDKLNLDTTTFPIFCNNNENAILYQFSLLNFYNLWNIKIIKNESN